MFDSRTALLSLVSLLAWFEPAFAQPTTIAEVDLRYSQWQISVDSSDPKFPICQFSFRLQYPDIANHKGYAGQIAGELSWVKQDNNLFLKQQFIGIDLFENSGLAAYPLSYAYLLDDGRVYQATKVDGCTDDKDYFCGISRGTDAIGASVALVTNKLALTFRRAKSAINTEVFLNISAAAQDKESYSKFLACMESNLKGLGK